MTIGPMGGAAASAAGAPLAQTKGSEADRALQDVRGQQRQVQNDQHAADAAGIGQTEEDQEASERDADGRRLWEHGPQPMADDEDAAAGARQSKDASGESGNALDLTG